MRNHASREVLDSRTGQPVQGAVVAGRWTTTKGLPGLSHTVLVGVRETETDAHGHFELERLQWVNGMDDESVVVYKLGYLAWNNQFLGPGGYRRHHYGVPATILLEEYPPALSHGDHYHFVMSQAEWEGAPGRAAASKLRQAAEPERQLGIRGARRGAAPPAPGPVTARGTPGTFQPSRTDLEALASRLRAAEPAARRQAVDVLGQTGRPEAAEPLLPLLRDPDPFVRQAVARALGELKNRQATEPLLATRTDRDRQVRLAALGALGSLQDPRAIEPLLTALLGQGWGADTWPHTLQALQRYQDLGTRRIIVRRLIREAAGSRAGHQGHSEANSALIRLVASEGTEAVLAPLQDPAGPSVAQTIRNYIELMESNWGPVGDLGKTALERHHDRALVVKEAARHIAAHLQDDVRSRPIQSMSLLGRLRDRRGTPVLLSALAASSGRRVAAEALGELGDPAAVEPLLEVLNIDEGPHGASRGSAAEALGRLGDPRAVEPLMRIVADKRESMDTRERAAWALAELRDRRAVDVLIGVLNEHPRTGFLEVVAVRALGLLGDPRAVGPIEEAARRERSGYVADAAKQALQRLRRAP